MPSPSAHRKVSSALRENAARAYELKLTMIKSYLEEGSSLRLSTTSVSSEIVQASQIISASFRNGSKLLTFGNGGSAADAQHIAAEFTGRFGKNRDALPAIALTTNSSELTAIANDYGFENVLSRQVQALAKPADIVMGISTSGSSRNVLNGLATARQLKVRTIGLAGNKGKMALFSDILIAVPSDKTPLIQEVHIAIGHLLCMLVEEELFG
jgi:D-sedoheptulose 7-phosphate isomerase